MTDVSTNGWDVFSVTDIETINKIINTDKLYPPLFSASDRVLGQEVKLAGKWGRWDVSNNASGGKVNIRCEIISGSVNYSDKQVNVNDGGNASYIEIEVLLKDIQVSPEQWVSGDDKITRDTRCYQLMIDTDNTVVVTEYHFTGPDMDKDGLSSVVPDLFHEWFNDNVDKFGQIFSVILVGLEAGNSDFQWLYPSAYSYAANGSIDGKTTGFGVLTLIDGKTDTGNLQQSVDIQALNLVKPFGANLALVISKAMFVKHMLLKAAVSVVKGSNEKDFTISDTGLSLTNNREMVWQDFDDGNGNTLSPTLPKNSFILDLQSDFIHLSIIGAHYRPKAGVTAYMSVEQNFRYKVEKNASGQPVFVPDETGLGDAQVTCSCKFDDWVTALEITLDIIGGLAAIFSVGSAMGGWLAARAAATVAELAAEEMTVFSLEGFEDALEEGVVTQEEVATEAEAAVAGATSRAPTLFNVAKICGALSGVILLAGITPEIMKQIYKRNYSDVPSFHDFARSITGTSVWPGINNSELKSASLADSFVIGIELK
ncbi:TULIP family P47-like protein [Serratia liquefaciens]|uniref:TULIP family P47-like protein n=1 Tax=Serratia liquefaciens TaxID=614 RepID=UPI00381A9522